jgi:hypothetical protein
LQSTRALDALDLSLNGMRTITASSFGSGGGSSTLTSEGNLTSALNGNMGFVLFLRCL